MDSILIIKALAETLMKVPFSAPHPTKRNGDTCTLCAWEYTQYTVHCVQYTVIGKARNKSYQTLLEKLVKSYHKLSKIVTKIWTKLQ